MKSTILKVAVTAAILTGASPAFADLIYADGTTVKGTGLGAEYENDLFMGSARSFPENQFGHIYHFELSQPNRRKIDVSDPRLNDRVADNRGKWDQVESESLLIGRNFAIVTDLETSPAGTLYAVANMLGAVYEIYRP